MVCKAVRGLGPRLSIFRGDGLYRPAFRPDIRLGFAMRLAWQCEGFISKAGRRGVRQG